MGRIICVLFAISCWVLGAFLAEIGRITAPSLIAISTAGGFFLTIVIWGKKGLIGGTWLVVFIACIYFFWQGFSGLFQTIPKNKPGNWAYLALIPCSFLALAIPVWVAKITKKIVGKKKEPEGKKEEKKEEEKAKKREISEPSAGI